MEILYKNIFEDAKGYERARIPGIICVGKSTLIAYCELRRSDSDWAVIDIGMKKSTDGGKTWSERKIAVSGEGENTVNNPVMISDGEIVHFLYCVNYHRVFYMRSTDEGESWSESEDITEKIDFYDKDFRFSCIATGPTHGITLNTGRLFVPVWMAYNKEDDKSHHPSVISVLYSDDKGETWKMGKIFNLLKDASEFCAAQCSDGTVRINIRHEGEEKCRATGIVDGFANITDVAIQPHLTDPVCCAGMCSSGKYTLFINCDDNTHRRNLTLKKLENGVNVKESFLVDTVGGYSDIAVNKQLDTAFVLYEHEKSLVFSAIKI